MRRHRTSIIDTSGFIPGLVLPFSAVGYDGKGPIHVRNIAHLVRWTARNADGGPRSEREVARAMFDFITEVDKLMTHDWKDRKAYSLDQIRHELREWLD